MWLCIFSHSSIKLTRVELRPSQPKEQIEHGDWNTRLMARCDSAAGAAIVIGHLDILLKDSKAEKGIYQLPFDKVFEAYRKIMDAAAMIEEPRPAAFYLIWASIIALSVWQVCFKLLTVFTWACLMIFNGGGKGGNILFIALMLRLADNRETIQRLLGEVRNRKGVRF